MFLGVALWSVWSAPAVAQLPVISDSTEAQTAMSDTSGTSEPLSVIPLVTPNHNGVVYELTWDDIADWMELPDAAQDAFSVLGWLFSVVGPVGGWLTLELPHWGEFCTVLGWARWLAVIAVLGLWWLSERRDCQRVKDVSVSAYVALRPLFSARRWGCAMMSAGLLLSVWGMLLGGVLIYLWATWQLITKKRIYLQGD